MKKIIPCLFCVCLIKAVLAQTTGKIIEQQVIKSNILGKEVRYTIYLPPDYTSSERTYPVVYLLHGYTDDNTGWLQFGEINRYTNKAIADGTIPPMIIVMPNGDSSWHINSYDGKEKYEDFFIQEFMPAIEKTYHIKAEKKYRGIAGLSMGGYGALIYSLKYPDLFAATGALSAAVRSDDQIINLSEDEWRNTFGQLYGRVYGRDLKGRERLTKTWYDNSVLKLVETKSLDDLKKSSVLD